MREEGLAEGTEESGQEGGRREVSSQEVADISRRGFRGLESAGALSGYCAFFLRGSRK